MDSMDRPANLLSRSIEPAMLQHLIERIFVAAGASPENASIVSEHLVRASLVGVDTHGVIHVPGYVRAIRDGLLDPKATPTIDIDLPAASRVRGHWGFGHVAVLAATRVGIQKSLDYGCSTTAIVECGHIGRVGHFTEIAAAQGVVAFLYAGGYGVDAPASVPFGGRDPILHTNPIAFATPGGHEPGPMFDFATTAVAGMKVSEARRFGRRLPRDSVVDSDGRPTDDPEAFFNGGSHVPFGGHKGYAISLQAEWLGRILTGADDFATDSPAEPVMRHQGVFGVFVRADLFSTRIAIGERTDDLVARIHAVEPAPEFDRVLVPGDPERTALAIRTRDGIPVDEETWEAIVAVGRDLGVDV
jgi:hydroxycarboxylate dehydrogenase B